MMWRTLGHFESVLPSPPFLRLSRSLIINRDRLQNVETPSREVARVTLQGDGRTAYARPRCRCSPAQSVERWMIVISTRAIILRSWLVS